MANTPVPTPAPTPAQQAVVTKKLGMFQAVGTAITAPVKGAATAGLFVGELADHVWSRREYIAEAVGNTTDLVILTAAAASRKAKKEMLGVITDIGDVNKTLDEIEKNWESK